MCHPPHPRWLFLFDGDLMEPRTAFILVLAASLMTSVPAVADQTAHAEAAMAAIEAERWDDALRELELAYRESPNPSYVYWRIIVLEKSDHEAVALELLRKHRAALSGLPEATELGAIEERLRAAVSETPDTAVTAETSAQGEPVARRAVVGPLVLGTAGLAATGLGLYGLLGADCAGAASAASTETCRRTNVATPLYLAGGIGALAGAITWYALSGNPREPSVSFFPFLVGGGAGFGVQFSLGSPR